MTLPMIQSPVILMTLPMIQSPVILMTLPMIQSPVILITLLMIQSPVILMTLQVTLRDTSKSHFKSCLYRRKSSAISKLGMRESMGGDFYQGRGRVSLNIIIMRGRGGGVKINFLNERGE